MFLRILSICIILFWGTMTFLLVRMQLSPDKDVQMLEIPPRHVWRMMFQNGQSSELSILQKNGRIGFVSLTPRANPAEGKYRLTFEGSISLPIHSRDRQRMGFGGWVEMDSTTSRLLAADCYVRDAEPGTRIRASWDASRRQVDYSVGFAKGGEQHGTYDLASISSMEWLRGAGIDPAAIQNMRTGITAPTMTARRRTLTTHGERVEAFHVAFRQGETPLLDIYVNQLGQVMRVESMFGYSLATDDLLP